MRNRLLLVTFLSTFLFAFAANAYDVVRHMTLPVQLKLNNAPLVISPEFKTLQDANSGFGLIIVEIDYTRQGGSAVTSINMTCFGNISRPGSNPVIDDFLQTCTTNAGICTSFDSIWQKAVNISKKWVWRIDAQGYDNVRCVLSTTGAAGTDTVTVHSKITSF